MKKMISLAVTGLAAVSASMFAEQGESTAIREGNNRIFFGGSYTFKNKIETSGLHDTNFTESKSKPWAGYAGYELKQNEGLYFKGVISYGGEEIKLKDSDDKFGYRHSVSGKVVGGYTFGLGSNSDFSLTPYAGFEYVQREMTRESSYVAPTGTIEEDTSVFGPLGYKTKEKSYYIPFGIAANFSVLPELDLGLVFEGQYGINRKIECTESDADQTVTLRNAADDADHVKTTKSYVQNGDKNESKKRLNFSIELPVKYQVNSEWDLVLTPFYKRESFKANDGKAATTTGTIATNGSLFNVDGEIKENKFGAKLELGCSF